VMRAEKVPTRGSGRGANAKGAQSGHKPTVAIAETAREKPRSGARR
jgi:hypothetical protein